MPAKGPVIFEISGDGVVTQPPHADIPDVTKLPVSTGALARAVYVCGFACRPACLCTALVCAAAYASPFVADGSPPRTLALSCSAILPATLDTVAVPIKARTC
jgi:hypothetical protein